MDELLDALRKEDEARIAILANELFITREGRCNYAQMNEFERYAPCKIVKLEGDSFGWLVGGIKYNDKTYSFG